MDRRNFKRKKTKELENRGKEVQTSVCYHHFLHSKHLLVHTSCVFPILRFTFTIIFLSCLFFPIPVFCIHLFQTGPKRKKEKIYFTLLTNSLCPLNSLDKILAPFTFPNYFNWSFFLESHSTTKMPTTRMYTHTL